MCGEVVAMRNQQRGEGMECRKSSADFRTEEWIDNEVVGCEFEDVRHGKRLRQLLAQLASRVGATTPWACQDWANTKAAYRFFGNERISKSNILAGHFACTLEGFSASRGFPLLVLHDTTELSYRHEDTASIGILKKIPAGHKGRSGLYTSCGILMALRSNRSTRWRTGQVAETMEEIVRVMLRTGSSVWTKGSQAKILDVGGFLLLADQN